MVQTRKNRLRIDQCNTFVLVANHVDEAFLINTLQNRQGVGVVAVHDKPIYGRHGLTILPDFTIDELAATSQPDSATLVIPGNDRCLHTLFSDPRVYDLIERRLTTQPENAIVTVPPAYALMLKAGLNNVTPSSVLTAEDKDFT